MENIEPKGRNSKLQVPNDKQIPIFKALGSKRKKHALAYSLIPLIWNLGFVISILFGICYLELGISLGLVLGYWSSPPVAQT